jgi:hypothetical protein
MSVIFTQIAVGMGENTLFCKSIYIHIRELETLVQLKYLYLAQQPLYCIIL